MEIRSLKIGLLIAAFFIFTACSKFEMRGFVLSYEAVDERFNQSMAWNLEHPFKEITVPEEEYIIFSMGDSHVGGTKNLDIFFEEAINNLVAAAVMVGDLTTGHAEDYLTFAEHVPSQESLITFPVIGNHDLYFNGWEQFYPIFGSSVYLFKVHTPLATDLYICLDSGSGTFGSNQLNWLKQTLETERSSYRHCVLFTHNNLFRIRHTTSTNPFVEELHVLMELCVKHQIDMVVTGHDHEKNEVVFGNTIHITMDALQDESKQAGFLKLQINPDEVAHEFVSLED